MLMNRLTAYLRAGLSNADNDYNLSIEDGDNLNEFPGRFSVLSAD